MLLPRVSELVGRFGAQGSGTATFHLVYGAEAHAVDEWPISEAPRDFKQHKTNADRLVAARALVEDFSLPKELATNFWADDIANGFDAAYASWPFRFWVLSSEAVLLKPMPKGMMYDLGDLERFLTDRQ